MWGILLVTLKELVHKFLKASSSPLIQARKQEELLPQMAGFPMPPTPKVV
jgi:hypothetical protein